MNELSRRLIDEWQGGFPLCEQPFAVVAGRLDSSEDAVLQALRELLADGTLTRFGPLLPDRTAGRRVLTGSVASARRISSASPTSSTNSRKWRTTTGAIMLLICGSCWRRKHPPDERYRRAHRNGDRPARIQLSQGTRVSHRGAVRGGGAAGSRFGVAPSNTPNPPPAPLPLTGEGCHAGIEAAHSCHPGGFAADPTAVSRSRRATEQRRRR